MAMHPPVVFLMTRDFQARLRRVFTSGFCLACAIAAAQATISGAQVTASDALVDQLVAESQKHVIQRTSDPEHPLRKAESYAVGLAEDLTLYNEWMLEIIRYYVEAGHLDDAEYLVKRLPGYGRALAHAELALIYARRHEAASADRHLEQAQQYTGQATGLTAEKIKSDSALALFHLDRKSEATVLMSQLGRLTLLSLEGQLHEDGLVKAIELLDAKRRLVSVSDKGEDERKARFLLACAKQHFKEGTAKSGEVFLDAIGEMAMENGLPNAQRVILDMAQVAWAGGQQKTARKAINLFLQCCQAYGAGAEWKPVFLADGVSVLLGWGFKDEVEPWLTLADQSMAGVFVLDAPEAYLAIADQYRKMGRESEVEARVTIALRSSAAYKHPRAFASAAVQVCLFYARSGDKIPGNISQILTQFAAEVGNQ